VSTGGSTNFLIRSLPDYRITDVKTNNTSIGVAFNNLSTNCDWTWANITATCSIVAEFTPRLTAGGIPFTWLSEHGISNRGDTVEQEDPDQDGFTTLQEYIADTDPRSGASTVPALQIRRGSSGSPELFVDRTSPARLYYFLSRTSLLSVTDWETNLWTPGTGSNLVQCLTNAADARFYRLQITR
jgi:hypothetical protein